MNNLFDLNNDRGASLEANKTLRAPIWQMQSETPDQNVREFFRMLARRKGILLGILAFGMIVSTTAVVRSVPQYTASAQVMIGSYQSAAMETKVGAIAPPIDEERIFSEVQIIRSKRLADSVISKFGLNERPEFNAALTPPPAWRTKLDPRTWMPAEWLDGIETELRKLKVLDAKAPAPTDQEVADLEGSKVLAAYQKKLAVTALDRSRVIEVKFTAEDPALAKKVADALVDLYIVEQLEAKAESTDRATVWLNGRLDSLRQQVEGSERAVEAFRARTGLTVTKDGTVPAQQLAELSSQLVLARARRGQAEANLRQAESLLNDRDGMGSVPEVLASPLIRTLREQEVLVFRKQAELADEYGDKHPKMISVRAELKNTQMKIDGEIDRIVKGLRNEIGVARAREAALEANVKQLEQRTAVLNQAEVELRALEREAGASRTLYETSLSRLKELTGQDDIQSADARVVTYASLPTASSSPLSPLLLLCTGFLGSVVLGVGTAGAAERFDSGFRSQEQVERALSIPAIGMLPCIPASAKAVNKYMLSNPFSAYAEAIRSVSIGLSPGEDTGPKTILISSAVPGEGKTLFSISLAQYLAKTGKKVVLVDCDLRQPCIHTALGFEATPGLAEVLANEISLEKALNQDPRSGAYVLTAGAQRVEAIDLVGSPRFAQLITRLRGFADVVIIDSAPLSAVGDTRIISRLADKTVFVVRWNSTPCRTSAFAVRQILESGADLAGVVLSRVDVAKHAQYGYGDSGYYHGSNRKYYQ